MWVRDILRSRLPVTLWVLLLLGALTQRVAAISIDIQSDTAAAGDVRAIAVELSTTGAEVAAAQNRIDFAHPLRILARATGEPDCFLPPGSQKEATVFGFLPVGCVAGSTCTGVRAAVISFANTDPIADGSVLYTCRVAVAANAAPGEYLLLNSETQSADSDGRFLPSGGASGTISVRAGRMSISIDDTETTPGSDSTINVRLEARGAQVVATQNRIDFTPLVRIGALPSGNPDCQVNPAIDKDASAFKFVPAGCAFDACTGIRAVVLAFDNLTLIPDGATLYTCRVRVDANADPGAYLLRNSELGGSGPLGADLTTSGRDGTVTVVADEALVAIEIGSVRTPGGQRATFDVHLDALDEDAPPVAGMQNEIFFEPSTPISATDDGEPECAVNPSIHKNGTDFLFLPPDCTPGINCVGVCVFVLALDNTAPIADGALLYSCAVQVLPGTAIGVYPLRNRNADASDPAARPVLVRERDGQVEVICAGDCDGNGQVAIFELLRGVNMLLGNLELSACPVFDPDGSGDVNVNEIIQAVMSGLRGCSFE